MVNLVSQHQVPVGLCTKCYDTNITMVSYSAFQTYVKYLVLAFQTYVKYLVKRRVQLVKRISIFLPKFCKFYKMQLEVQILAQPVESGRVDNFRLVYLED